MESIFFSITGVSITISFIIVFLLLLSSYFNDRYSVKWRYYIWLILAIRLVLPVDLGLTAPPLELIFNDHEIVFPFAGEQNPRMSADAGNNEGGNPPVIQDTAAEDLIAATASRVTGAEQIEDRHTTDKGLTVRRLASGIYFTGIAGFLLWQLGVYLSFRHATRRWFRKTEDEGISEVMERLKAELGIHEKFKLMICKKINSPMIIGLFRPILLLPHEGYQQIDLEVILKHELIHYKRNDLWFKLLLICANAMHWFNPFIYIMVREANKDIEISCDEEVLKGADLLLRKRYSERILELMQVSNHQEAPISTGFNGGKGMMKSRLKNIFDERIKKRGILSFLMILVLILGFSACKFDIGQNQWRIPISMNTADAYGWNESGSRMPGMSDTTVDLPFDLDQNGTTETQFSLLVTDGGGNCYLRYQEESGNTVQAKVLEGVEPGVDYGLQAANLEDTNSILFLVAVDYHGMPFGSGYWEVYSWKNREFKRVDVQSIEYNLQMRILEPAEIENNVMNAGAVAYLYDRSQYPVDYPAAGIYFTDDFEQGMGKNLNSIVYAPMSGYDVEGYRTWGQEAMNKIMTRMNFVSSESVKDWNGTQGALLETEEVVFITLPNITASVKRYYQYQDGKWASVDAYIQ